VKIPEGWPKYRKSKIITAMTSFTDPNALFRAGYMGKRSALVAAQDHALAGLFLIVGQIGQTKNTVNDFELSTQVATPERRGLGPLAQILVTDVKIAGQDGEMCHGTLLVRGISTMANGSNGCAGSGLVDSRTGGSYLSP
jgi:hypothetical protein